VIVIGAGSGGLTLATVLAQMGSIAQTLVGRLAVLGGRVLYRRQVEACPVHWVSFCVIIERVD